MISQNCRPFDKAYVNIARNHLKVRDREPIIVSFENEEYSNFEIDNIGNKLASIFDSIVYYGEYYYDEKKQYCQKGY